MDTLYYSNYCKHSENIKNFMVKKNLTQQVSWICIDNRSIEPQTGQIVVNLENGTRVTLPPNIHRVPTLILKKNYHAVEGNDIINYFEPIALNKESALSGGEPAGFDIKNSDTQYVSANHNSIETIRALPDNYKSNKISPNVTIEMLEKNREKELLSL
jgi:hypothetical protein